MGAVPGGRILIRAPVTFDVDSFRSLGRPTAVVHQPAGLLLVLGSTQPESVVDAERAAEAGVAVARRRGGGGAVLVVPATTVWVDLWIPAGAEWFDRDPGSTARRVGGWWRDALEMAGATGLEVSTGPGPGPTPLARLVCFASVGAGEVHLAGRKVVGLTQWRGREGSLVQGCAYRAFEPALLIDLLSLPASRRRELAALVSGTACGFEDAGVGEWSWRDVVGALPGADLWEMRQHS